MTDNAIVLSEELALAQLINNNFSATNGYFEDSNVTTLRGSAFIHKTNVIQIFLPNVTSMDSHAHQFNGCTNLEKLFCKKMSGGLPVSCCSDCQNLKIVDFGNITLVGQSAFYHNYALETLILRRKTAICNLVVNAFAGTKYATNGSGNAYVYVPRDLISAYQTDTNWSQLYAAHPDMFRPLEDYTIDGTTTGDFDESLITPPLTPLYAVTNLEVGPDENHLRFLTTTSEGHITLSSGECSSELWGYIYINHQIARRSAGDAGSLNTIFNIAPGQTVKIVIKGCTFTNWANTLNRISVSLNTAGRNIVEATWAKMKEAFYTNGLSRYEVEYTNTGTDNIPIRMVQLSGVLMANQTLDFGLMILIDGVRYI